MIGPYSNSPTSNNSLNNRLNNPNSHNNSLNNNRGFTIIELMIAVALVAVLSILTFSAISASFRSYEIISTSSARASDQARIFAIMNDDFINLVPRPIRTNRNTREGAFILDSQEEYLISLTRGGTAIIDRSPEDLRQMGIETPMIDMTRVAYKFADRRLYRYEWAILDRDGQNDIPEDSESILLEDVLDVQVVAYSYRRDGSLQEEVRWPPTALTGRSRNKEFLLLPAGIQMRIILEEGEISMFFPGSLGVTI